jgi:hypothetical protein
MLLWQDDERHRKSWYTILSLLSTICKMMLDDYLNCVTDIQSNDSILVAAAMLCDQKEAGFNLP